MSRGAWLFVVLSRLVWAALIHDETILSTLGVFGIDSPRTTATLPHVREHIQPGRVRASIPVLIPKRELCQPDTGQTDTQPHQQKHHPMGSSHGADFDGELAPT